MERESEALIRLGMLLRRRRSPDAQRAVQQIVQSSLSSVQKIERIRDIDRAEVDAPTPEQPRREVKERYFGTVPGSTEAGRTKRRAKKPPRVKAHFHREGYFSFLFKHRFRILQFGTATKTIRSQGFPPSIRIAPQVPAYHNGFLQPVAKDITTILSQLMGNAWVYLRKQDYNILVQVLELCHAITRVPLEPAAFRDPGVIDRLAAVEEKLLAIRYHEGSIAKILDAIATLQSWNRRHIENLQALPGLVKRLLSRSENRPCLVDIVLALNMFKFRRYITEPELSLKGLGRMVDEEVYDCPPPTQARIDEYIDRILIRLSSLVDEQREVMKLRGYVPRETNGEVGLGPVIRLYERHQVDGWEKDYDRPAALAEAIVRGFLDTYAAILTRPVELSGVGTSLLFTGQSFDEPIARMERMADAVGALRFELPGFNRERYLQLRHKSGTPVEREAEFLMHLDLLLDILAMFRERLSPILGAGVAAGQDFSGIDVRVSADVAEGLPLDATILDGRSPLQGRTLRDALMELVAQSYLIPFVFADKRILQLLRREREIKREMDYGLETIDRIAEPERAAQIRARYSGLVGDPAVEA